MLQNSYFKIFIWFITTSFFFMATVLIIAVLSPPPNQTQIMQFMNGMMNAMHSSFMGFSMGLEKDNAIMLLLDTSSNVLVPLISVALLSGIFIRIRRHK